MSAAAHDEKNINLLPHDRKKREQVRRAIHEHPEFVEAPQTKSKPNGSIKQSLFSLFFKKKKAHSPEQKPVPAPQQDLPDGAALPSGLFKNVSIIKKNTRPSAPRAYTEPPKTGSAPQENRVLVPPVSAAQFRQNQQMPASHTPPATLATPLKPKPKQIEKHAVANAVSWWRRLFFKPHTPHTKPATHVYHPDLAHPSLHAAQTTATEARAPEQPAQAESAKQLAGSAEGEQAKKAEETSAQKQATPIARMSDQFEVNLLSREYQRAFENQNPWLVFAGSSAVAVLLVAVVYASVYVYRIQNENKLQSIEAANIALQASVAQYAPISTQDIALREQALMIQTLLKNHVSWTTFLTKLEAATIPEITYTSLAATAAGAVHISALATNYTSLARQMTVYMDDADWITDLSVDSAALLQQQGNVSGLVQFDIDMNIDKSVFIKP